MPAYRIEWLAPARAHIRAIDRATAMRLFEGVVRFASFGLGDVKALQGNKAGEFRLRLGDYRVFFTRDGDTMRISAVRHRSEAYR